MKITEEMLIEKGVNTYELSFFETNKLYGLEPEDLAIKLLEMKETEYFRWLTTHIHIKDTKRFQNRITKSRDAYMYCYLIKDTQEMRNKITDSFDAYYYCSNIKDTKEMRDKINDSRNAYMYCRYVKDRKSIRDRILENDFTYLYYKFVSKKDKRINKTIMSLKMKISKKLLLEKKACHSGLSFMKENNFYGLTPEELAVKLLEMKEYEYFDWLVENIQVEDTSSIKNMITDSDGAYLYCRYIKDTKEMRSLITDSKNAFLYCLNIKDTKKMRDKITENKHYYMYCREVKDRPEMRSRIR